MMMIRYITSTAESWEILSLGHKLSVILDHLRDQLAVCKGLVGEFLCASFIYKKPRSKIYTSLYIITRIKICWTEKKKAEDAYIAFKRLIESTHIDNMKVLRAMIRARDDQRPLYDGSKRINVRVYTYKLFQISLAYSHKN